MIERNSEEGRGGRNISFVTRRFFPFHKNYPRLYIIIINLQKERVWDGVCGIH